MNKEMQVLRKLETIGYEIISKGYCFDRLHQAVMLYFPLVLNHFPDIKEEDVVFAPAQKLEWLSEAQARVCLKRVHQNLPAELRSRCTVEDVIRIYEAVEQQVDWFYPGRRIIGHYNWASDKCYVNKDLPVRGDTNLDELKTLICVHELSHRFVYKKRLEQDAVDLLADSDKEEHFARASELVFASYAFPKARHNTVADLKEGCDYVRERLVPEIVDFAAIAQATHNVVDSYARRLLKKFGATAVCPELPLPSQ